MSNKKSGFTATNVSDFCVEACMEHSLSGFLLSLPPENVSDGCKPPDSFQAAVYGCSDSRSGNPLGNSDLTEMARRRWNRKQKVEAGPLKPIILWLVVRWNLVCL